MASSGGVWLTLFGVAMATWGGLGLVFRGWFARLANRLNPELPTSLNRVGSLIGSTCAFIGGIIILIRGWL